MPINGKIYTMRAVTVEDPNPGPGGMYATSAGIDQPIQAGAQVPDLFDKQYWRFEEVEGNVWQIINVSPPHTADSAIRVGGPGFTSTDVKPGDAVTLTNTASSYKILQDIHVGGNEIIVISPADAPERTGATWVVGSCEGTEVKIVSIPVIRDPLPTPAWSLNPQD
ncbi:hypothetical protein BDV93DRAFT_611790 [Ceratobasidium sp. AG-I]|nr:hypothetical protein BDV93DRAFT_611790 [Ceratobasidium sp. AG-I]